MNQFMVECINRALEFKSGECFDNTPIPFCSLHTKIADDDTKTYTLEFSSLSDWNYTKSVPLEKMEYDYVVNTIKTQLVEYMKEWAEHLIETEMLEESEES